jgi:alpha/beta hydrolase fold
MPDRPFPFLASASTMPTMPTLVQREAELSLRSTGDFVRPRVIWPPNAPDGSPIALFLWDRDSCFEAADALCVEGGFVVLALRTAALDLATIALEWAGDHAALLGADPSRLVVAGGGLAATTTLYARDQGWPPIARQLLFGPDVSGWPPAGARLAGAAPALVVSAPRYAQRLRDAGVEVRELSLAEPMDFDWLRAMERQQM